MCIKIGISYNNLSISVIEKKYWTDNDTRMYSVFAFATEVDGIYRERLTFGEAIRDAQKEIDDAIAEFGPMRFLEPVDIQLEEWVYDPLDF